jgi:hypothetical protein
MMLIFFFSVSKIVCFGIVGKFLCEIVLGVGEWAGERVGG